MSIYKTMNINVSPAGSYNLEGGDDRVPGCGDCGNCVLWMMDITSNDKVCHRANVLYCEYYHEIVTPEVRSNCDRLVPKTRYVVVSSDPAHHEEFTVVDRRNHMAIICNSASIEHADMVARALNAMEDNNNTEKGG